MYCSRYGAPLRVFLGGVAEGAIVLVAVSVAVEALGANLSVVTSNLTLIVGAMVVVAGFLFAWAMRSPAEEIIAN